METVLNIVASIVFCIGLMVFTLAFDGNLDDYCRPFGVVIMVVGIVIMFIAELTS